MEINFTGKTALVTGAGKGIGRATAQLLAKCGANVIAVSRTQDDLDSLKEAAGTVKTICADLADLDNVIQAIKDTGDHIDLLVNNAAHFSLKKPMDVTEEDFDKSMLINVKVPLRLSQYVSREIISKGSTGAIVNVSSISSDYAPMPFSPYGVTKAALDNLTMSLAVELAPYKIRVNSILPGLTNTPIVQKYAGSGFLEKLTLRYPKGQIAEADEIAHTIAYLLSDKSSNIIGARIISDGGYLINA